MKNSLIVALLLFSFLSPLILVAQGTSSQDEPYMALSNSIQILKPAYWLKTEKEITYIDGSKLETIVLEDQAEKQSRTTKFAVASRGKTSSVFRLSEEVASKLQPRDFVNLYIDRFLRDTVGGKLISAKLTEADGAKKYYIELEYLSTNKIRFAKTDIFIFKGDMVYHLDGEYMTNISGLKEKIDKILQSFKVLK